MTTQSMNNNNGHDPWWGIIALATAFMAAVAGIAFSATSCSPRLIETVRTEIQYQDRYHRDSLFLHDSIYIKEAVKGDTVYLDKYVYKYIYKDRLKTDTVMVEKVDSVVCEHIVEVEKPLTVVQKAKMNSFWWLVITVVALLAWTFRKQIKALI